MKTLKYGWIFVVLAGLVLASVGCGGSATANPPTAEATQPAAAATEAAEPTEAVAEPTQAVLAPAASLTALAAYKLAEPVAKEWQADAELITLSPFTAVPVADAGAIQTDQWMVQFYSPAAAALKNVLVQNGQAQGQPEIANALTDDRSIPDPASLLDSDEALALAEANGGAAARQADASIKLVQISLVNDGEGNLKWVINYSAEDFSVKYTVHVNAQDGVILLNIKL